MPDERPLPEIVPVTPPDAESRLHQAVKQVRQRRRRRAGVAVSAVAVLAVGASLTALNLGHGGNHADQVATLIQPSPTPSPPAPAAALPIPHYLPPGVSMADDNGHEVFTLAGRANINTMPSDSALLIANPTGYHPASHLTYTIRPGTSGGDPPEVQTQFFTVQKLTISGHPGWSWVGKTNYGDEYVTWTDGQNSYELYCSHLHTIDGDSGVDMAQLIRMAQSVS